MVIEKLELFTADIAETRRFYAEILGMPLLAVSDHEVLFAAGKTRLCFKLSKGDLHPVYHFAFTIPSNKLEEAYRLMSTRLQIMDVPPEGKIADFSNWNAAAFYFYDNNGNIVEFIARYDISNQTEEAFSGGSIYAVSEIGLVTDNVPALLKDIGARFGIPLFAKQPPQERFAVMGDDEGLLIVVAGERPWFPTRVKSAQFPLHIDLRNNAGKLFHIDFPTR